MNHNNLFFFILVLEMTDKHVAIFPMMIVALVAQWAAHFTDPHSFYELVKASWLPKVSTVTTTERTPQ